MALILVVEDETPVRELIKTKLEESHLVIDVSNGADALRLVQKVRPAIVILDINLSEAPGELSGLQTCQKLAEARALAGMPILAMSGRSDADTISKIEGLGAIGFIAKPFGMEELERRVEQLLTIQVATVAHYLMSLGEKDLAEAIKIALRNGNTMKIARVWRQAILDVENELAEGED